MAKRSLKWWVVAALVLVLVVGVGKTWQTRQARQAQAAAALAALQVPTVFQLAEQDVVRVRSHTLQQSVEVSGALRAVHSAIVKAKASGELSGLQVREGDAVQSGQVLARIDPTDHQARVRQADQQAQAAAAQVAIAQRQLDNNQALVNQGFISKTALENSLANLDSAQANHRAALAALDLVRKALADTVVRSPISGHVSARLVQNGERVGVEARLLEVVDVSRLELEAAVPPSQAAGLRVGQTARLRVEGLGEPVAARVARIGVAAQAGSRSVPVYLTLDGAPGLRHGLFAQGRVTVGEHTGTALPADSVRNDKPTPYVQLLQATDDPSTYRIAHAPVTRLASGHLAQVDQASDSAASVEYIITNSIAENSIITSVRAGFIQENITVKPPAR